MLTFDYPQTYAVTGSAEEQLAQLRSYIWQLVDVLNQAGDGNEAGIGTADTAALRTELENLRKALRDLEAKSGHGLPSGGTVSGNLTVTGNVTSSGTVDGQMISGQIVTAYSSDHKKQIALECTGQNAGRFSGEVSGGVLYYARMAVATPTDDNDATTKAYVDGKVAGLQTADQVQTAINSAISGVYTPKGSIAFASLPTAVAGNKGWVYNVTDAFTTTAAFVEGAGHAYGAGTNVVCVDAGSGSYKWDVLAGTIDLTELTADEVQTLWDSI